MIAWARRVSSATSASREAEFNARPLDLKGPDGCKHPASLGASPTCTRPKFRFQTRDPHDPDVPVGCGPHHKAWKAGASPAHTRPIPERAVSLRRGESVQPQEGTRRIKPVVTGLRDPSQVCLHPKEE